MSEKLVDAIKYAEVCSKRADEWTFAAPGKRLTGRDYLISWNLETDAANAWKVAARLEPRAKFKDEFRQMAEIHTQGAEWAFSHAGDDERIAKPKGRKMATAKKPSAAQLAARARFAAMARSGKFKRKSNPSSAAGEFRESNPRKRKGIKSPSIATGEPPSKRLVKRRTLNAKAAARGMKGFYANPAKVRTVAKLANYYPSDYNVHKATTGGKPGVLLARFPKKADAVQYAEAYAKAHDKSVVVVGGK